MRARIASGVVLVSAVIYASIVLGYSSALRSSAQRSAQMERVSNARGGLVEGSSQLESLRNKLAAKISGIAFATDSRGFAVLLQRIALVARRSHVAVVGVVPDSGGANDTRSDGGGRGLAIRIRGRFSEALHFLRLLPAAGILLRIGDVAFAPGASSSSAGTLDVTIRTTLLRPIAKSPGTIVK